jgi:hypothetical protein
MEIADKRECEKIVAEFEYQTSQSQAVICCDFSKLLPMIQAGSRFPNFDHLFNLWFLQEASGASIDWVELRATAEGKILGSKKNMDKLHYACLTLNGEGLPHYGNCEILLREEMIAHRVLVIRENSAAYFQDNTSFSGAMRSDWQRRAKLCVVKHVDALSNDSRLDSFHGILLKPGAKVGAEKGTDDVFVELVILGDLTMRSFKKITIRSEITPREESQLKDLCRNNDVYCEVL